MVCAVSALVINSTCTAVNAKQYISACVLEEDNPLAEVDEGKENKIRPSEPTVAAKSGFSLFIIILRYSKS